MNNRIINQIKGYRRLSFCVAVAAVMMLFLFGPLNHYLFESLYNSNYYHLGVPMLIAAYFACRGFRDGTEMTILILYMLWAVITRIANGDTFLLKEGDYLIDLSTMILMFAPGILLAGQVRNVFFRSVSGILTVFYLVASLICIYAAATGSYLLNPLDLHGIGYSSLTENRFNFLSFQWNETAGQFAIAFALCLTLFFQTKSMSIRLLLVFAAVCDFIVVGITKSRNGQTCVCLALGLLLGILVTNHLRSKQIWIRVAAMLLTVVVVAVSAYQLFEPIRYSLWSFSQTRTKTVSVETNAVEPTAADSGTEKPVSSETEAVTAGEVYQADSRDYLESGRKQIFWSALKSLQIEPRRLLVGSSYDHVMDISHQLIREQAKHFHNTFLQVINEFGILGLLLVLWFYFRILFHVYSLGIVPNTAVSAGDQMLMIVPLMLMFYYMLEVGIFKIVDMANIRNTVFFFACGMLTGIARDRKRDVP